MPFIILIVIILVTMVCEALTFTAFASVFLDLDLWAGWHAAWDRPGWLLAFALISLIFSAGRRS
jgi:hypothetical protein